MLDIWTYCSAREKLSGSERHKQKPLIASGLAFGKHMISEHVEKDVARTEGPGDYL